MPINHGRRATGHGSYTLARGPDASHTPNTAAQRAKEGKQSPQLLAYSYTFNHILSLPAYFTVNDALSSPWRPHPQRLTRRDHSDEPLRVAPAKIHHACRQAMP